jgi:hypothetical protein
VPEVRIASLLQPYVSDPILRIKVRYQCNGYSVYPNFTFITRANVLNQRLLTSSGTTSYRLFQSVKVNKIEIVTSSASTFQWKSNYGPTSNTLISGTSTTAAGTYSSSPPQNSLASFWSTSGINESENLMSIALTSGDYVTVWYSCVLQDEITNVAVTTNTSNATGQIYGTFLDGPGAGKSFPPVGITNTF